MKLCRCVWLGLAFLFLVPLHAASAVEVFAKEFEESQAVGTLVIERLSDGQRWVHNSKRADKRMIPASTFKIANTLIALDLNIVSHVDDIQPWDGKVRRIKSWNEPQSLRNAFANSAVPVYQRLARKIGQGKMQQAVSKLGYGNKQTGSKIDDFWLVGPLRISATEQVEFLRRLYARSLPVSLEAQEGTIEIMQSASGEAHIERGKTGWEIESKPAIGWYVGWVETASDVVFFALNMDMTRPFHRTARTKIVRQALKRMGAME